jgi:integrase/recombinase XerD
MDVVVIITEFKHQLRARGYAENTIEIYRKNLDFFARYLTECSITDIKKVSHQVILDYQAKVRTENNAMETKAIKIRSVKRLFEYLEETHKLLVNPAEGIVETCRKNRKIGVILTVNEINRLFEQPNLSVPMQIRDRAIMEVFYSTAIRLDELLNLEVYHADLKDKVLYIRKGKGRKQRVVPLGTHAVRYLKEYLHKIRPMQAKKRPKERKLFLCHNGDPVSRGTIGSRLREYRIRAGIEKPVSPHTFRRTCATHMLQNGADIRYIQELLGHKDLRTTQFYTKIIPVDIKKTHNKTHPKLEDNTCEG